MRSIRVAHKQNLKPCALQIFSRNLFSGDREQNASELTVLGIVIGTARSCHDPVGQRIASSIQSSIPIDRLEFARVTPGEQRVPGAAVSAGRGSAQR